jgi:hypothetical protein
VRNDPQPLKQNAAILRKREHSWRFTAFRLRQFLKNPPGNSPSHAGNVTVSTHMQSSKAEWTPPAISPDKFTALIVISVLSRSPGNLVRIWAGFVRIARADRGPPMI